MKLNLKTSREVSFTLARCREIALIEGWGANCSTASILAHALDELEKFESEIGEVDFLAIYDRDAHSYFRVPHALDCGQRFETCIRGSEEFFRRLDFFTATLASPFSGVRRPYRNLSCRLLLRFLVCWHENDVPVIERGRHE